MSLPAVELKKLRTKLKNLLIEILVEGERCYEALGYVDRHVKPGQFIHDKNSHTRGQ